jgi:rhodanese-related sulfurtransferase
MAHTVAFFVSRIRGLSYIGSACFVLLLGYTIAPRFSTRTEDLTYVQDIKQRISGLPIILPGKGITVRRVDLSAHPYTWVLFTSPDCSFCVKSADFHRRLYTQATSHRIPVVVSVPSVRNARGFLESTGLAGAIHVGWEDVSRRPQGTPALALVGQRGDVRRVWLGQLPPDAETEVFNAMADPARIHVPTRHLQSGERMLTLADVKLISAKKPPVLLSIAERTSYSREHLAGAVNIPLAELAVRAPLELKARDLTIVDCTAELDVKCSMALKTLAEFGLRGAPLDTSGDATAEAPEKP